MKDMTRGENVTGFNFSVTQPTPITNPYVACQSSDCMELIGLDKVAWLNED